MPRNVEIQVTTVTTVTTVTETISESNNIFEARVYNNSNPSLNESNQSLILSKNDSTHYNNLESK
jgi:hypothetical protein